MPPKKTAKKSKTQPKSHPGRKPKKKNFSVKVDAVSMRSTRPDTKMGSVIAAPSAIGYNVGPSILPKSAGPPQYNTAVTSAKDWTTQLGVRMIGSDLLNDYLSTGHALTDAFGGISSAGSTATPQMPLTPSTISARLAQQEEIYQYYAFRELLFEFTPSVSPTAVGGVSNQPIGTYFVAAAVCQDGDTATALVSTSATLAQQVMELVPSVGFSAWEGGKLLYTFHGERVYETDTLSMDPEIYVQAFLCAGTYQPLTDSSNVYPLASIRVTYVIDFYCPAFPQANPAIVLRTGFERICRAFDLLLRGADLKDRKTIPKDAILRQLVQVKTFHSPKHFKQCPSAFMARDQQILKFAKYFLDCFVDDSGKYQCPVQAARSRKLVLSLPE